MKILVALAFIAILASLGSALFYMMRGGTRIETNSDEGAETTPAPKGNMVKALAIRVGFSIVLFICILIAWKMGYIQPSGIPAGA
ncbi:MAG: twin transmembrane helix small protein [Comamonadaceae bacterium]|jgi:glycerol uptake facilitator-like aquaporin|nr:twin transmembrane helix small protein [Comamonadaceae bacterium]